MNPNWSQTYEEICSPKQTYKCHYNESSTQASPSGNPPISVKWKEVPTAASIDEAMMDFISENAVDVYKNAVRTSSRPKRTPITRNEDFLWSMNSSKTV
jgi:hypothetical protein